jgi:polyhydroxyalkanoate synthesis regulator phasin
MWKPTITIFQERFGQMLTQVQFVGDKVEVVEMLELPLKTTKDDVLKWADDRIKVLEKAKPEFVAMYAKREITYEEMVKGEKLPVPKTEVDELKEKIAALEAENADLKKPKGGK